MSFRSQEYQLNWGWAFWLAVLLCLGVTGIGLPAYAQQSKHVLVLHSYHQGLQWTDNISSGIKQELLKTNNDIELHFEYLDTKRISGEEYFKRLGTFEEDKYRQAKIQFDVIIVSDNNALRFVLEYGDRLYPGVPVVFCGINNFQPAMLANRTDITGVVEGLDYVSTLQLMSQLHPDRKKVTVILDRTPTGNAIETEFDQVDQAFFDRFQFELYRDFTLEELSAKIASLGSDDLIYLLACNRDREGTFISYVNSVKLIRQASQVPIYGSWDFYFGHGIVGGMITSGVAQGQLAALLAKEILDGREVESLPVVTKSPNRYMFDYNELVRFNIDRSELPADAVVINLPPSFIDQHKRVIAGALAVIALLALLLAWRLHLQKRRQRMLFEANIELDRRVAEQTEILAHKNQALEGEIRERIQVEKQLTDKQQALETALAEVKTLSGLLPICANCKRIRDDKGYWNQLEAYMDEYSDVTFSHDICPTCAQELYPDLFKTPPKS